MNTGSPLAARLNINPFIVILIFAVLAAAVVGLFFLNKLLSQYRESYLYAEKNKDRPTSKKDLAAVTKKAELTKIEQQILYSIFEKYPVPNVHFALKDQDIVEAYLKEAWTDVENSSDEALKASVFTLRAKALKFIESRVILKNTRILPIQTVLTYTPSQGIHLPFIIIESTQDEIWLELPDNIKEEEKPEILSKIKFNFIYLTASPYEIETRVVRYQADKNNKPILVCTQSDNITPLQKRFMPRIDLNAACVFSSVKADVQTTGKTTHTTYTASEKTHEGVLADTSAGGCRIFTKLPIKAGQYLLVKAKLDGINENEAVGKILRTTKNRNDDYILHIKFEKIDKSVENNINAVACGYIC